MSPDPPSFAEPTEWVSEDIIRYEFNRGNFVSRVQAGELVSDPHADHHMERPPPRHPPCTRSQFVIYRTRDGEPVAGVHQYLLPDGRFGGSGKPDPKRLV